MVMRIITNGKTLSEGLDFSEGVLGVFGDLGSEDGGGGQVVDVFEALIAEPERVGADLVAGDELVVDVALEAVRLLALEAVAGPMGRRSKV